MRSSLRLLVASMACTLAVAPSWAATPSARAMYNRALEREEAVRPSLEGPRVKPAALGEARKVVKAYERLAARYPGSGYTDNALWQAAVLSAHLWERTGDTADRSKALELYQRLINGYSSSSLVGRARPAMRQLQLQRSRPEPAQSDAREDRVLPVPPPATLEVRDVPPLPPAPLATSGDTAGTTGKAKSTDRATIRDVKRVSMPGTVRVIIELDREVPYHEERIGDPDRVFIDLARTQPRSGLRPRQAFRDGVVRQIRVGQRPDDGTRVVLDVDGAARHSVFALYDPYRLVIDCELPVQPTDPWSASTAQRTTGRAAALPAVAPKAAPTGAHASAAGAAGMPAGTPPVTLPPPRSRGGEAETNAPIPARRPGGGPGSVAGAPTLSGTPSATLDGRFSLSRQLGLGIARIVIDPGHGGHDPGAQVKGLNESELVLDIALRLEQLLLRQPGVEVVLTRRTDVFIPLEERTAIANREEADLFLSIHANASRNPRARGIETYFLNFASNPEAQAVAARENAASGLTMHSLPDIVKAITLNNKLDESRDFAMMVQRAMVQRLRRSGDARDLGVKQAPFVVLIGAGMPSVLAEISFITNPQEGRLLKSTTHRQRVAEALFDGIAQYQRAVKNVKTVENQNQAAGRRR